jgi:hypothetical protein
MHPNEPLLNPTYWRNRAELARSMAVKMDDGRAADALDGAARCYDELARLADEHRERAAGVAEATTAGR